MIKSHYVQVRGDELRLMKAVIAVMIVELKRRPIALK